MELNYSEIIIPPDILDKWQKTVDLMTDFFEVPASNITKIHDKEIELLAVSKTDSNPFQKNNKIKLNIGLYCYEVISKKKMVHIPNASKNKKWGKNQLVGIDMISYLGAPILWPDNSIFGTICILDSKERNYSTKLTKLIIQFKDLIEADLKYIVYEYETKKRVINQIIQSSEDKILKNEELLNEVGNIAKIGGWEMDLIARKAYWTKGTYDIVEIEYDKPIPGPDEHISYYLPEYQKIVEKSMHDLIENDISLNFDAKLKTAKGNIKWCRALGKGIRKDGVCIKVFGTFQDITEMKEAELALKENELKVKEKNEEYLTINEELRESYERIQQINKELLNEKNKLQNYLNIAEVMFVAINNKGEVDLINKEGCKILGYKKEKEIIGKSWFDNFLPERLRKEVKEVFKKVISGDITSVEYYENPILNRKGEERLMAWHNTIIKDANGNIITSLSSGEDITERKKAEKALKEQNKEYQALNEEYMAQNEELIESIERLQKFNIELGEAKKKIEESEERYRKLFNLAQEGIWVIDADSITTMVNNSMAKMLGYNIGEMTGKHLFSFMDEKGIRIASENLERQKKGISEQFDLEFIHKKGKRIHTTIGTAPITDEKGKYYGAIGGVMDITEKKQNQQNIYNAVIHAEEEERSRVAKDLHDGVLPVLSTLKLYLQSLYDSKEKKLRSTLMTKVNETINDAIASIKEISNNLSPHVLHNFGLISALQTFIARITEVKNIKIDLKYNFESRFYENIEISLYRVLIELINNTIKHAMASAILIVLNKKNGIHLHYEDNGKGFDYVQVTKNKNGMGLFNMKNRIESINGEVTIISSSGKGTKVDILIPLHE